MKRVAIAVIAVLALTGCTEIGSIANKAQIDLALNNLTSELDELAGIQTDYTAEMQVDYSYRVSVHATGSELSTAQLVAAALLVQNELGSTVFDGTPVNFDLMSAAGTSYSASIFDLTESELAGDIAYASAFGEAYGAPVTVFFGEGNTADTYGRVVSVSAALESPDWPAIRALPDTSRAFRSWQVPGLSFNDQVPSSQVTDLVAAIGAITPLLSFSDMQTFDSFATVDSYSTEMGVSYVSTGLDVADPTASPSWNITVQIARLILDSGLGPVTFAHYPFNGTGYSSVVLGACSEAAPMNDADTVLAAALTSALGTEVQAGMCLHA